MNCVAIIENYELIVTTLIKKLVSIIAEIPFPSKIQCQVGLRHLFLSFVLIIVVLSRKRVILSVMLLVALTPSC